MVLVQDEKNDDEFEHLDYNNMYSIMVINVDTDGYTKDDHRLPESEISVLVQWVIDNEDTDITAPMQAIERFYSDLSDIQYESSSTSTGHPVFAASTTDIIEYPWLTATMNLNSSGVSRCFKNKSAYMLDGFSESEIDTIIEFSTKQDPKQLIKNGLLQIDSYGGMINNHQSNDTAYPQRSSCMKLQYQVYWDPPSIDDVEPFLKTDVYCRDWIDRYYKSMYEGYKYNEPYPDGKHVDGCYVNYCDVDLKDWSYLYYKDNYQRLQNVKCILDPHQIFWHRQSIRGNEMKDKAKTLLPVNDETGDE